MQRRALSFLVMFAAASGLLSPGSGHALPFTKRSVTINASGVSDVVFENGLIFGTQMQSGKVWVADPVGGTIVTTLSVSVSRTHVLAADGVNHRVYITNYDAGTLSVIDSSVVPPVLLSNAAVGTHPVAVDVDPTSKRVFIGLCCEESRTVIALDGSVSPPAPITTIAVGQGPDHLAVDTSNGYVYVGNYDSASISIIKGRLDPPAETGFIALPQISGRPLRPNAMAVNPATDVLYVSTGDNTGPQHEVDAFDTGTGATLARTSTAQWIANDIVVDPVKNLVWYTLATAKTNLWFLNGDKTRLTDLPFGKTITPGFANFAIDPATTRLFGAGQDAIVVMEDDSVDPQVVITTADNSVQITTKTQAGGTTEVSGTATDDNSGIAVVILTLVLQPTDTLTKTLDDNKAHNNAVHPIGNTIFANLKCDDLSRRSCSWSRQTGVAPGYYKMFVTAFDIAGNRNGDDHVFIVAV